MARYIGGMDVVESLILDLLEFVVRRQRTYAEVLEAWRTSCPRLPVWEEANERELVHSEEVNGRSIVCITARGREFLERFRPAKVSEYTTFSSK